MNYEKSFRDKQRKQSKEKDKENLDQLQSRFKPIEITALDQEEKTADKDQKKQAKLSEKKIQQLEAENSLLKKNLKGKTEYIKSLKQKNYENVLAVTNLEHGYALLSKKHESLFREYQDIKNNLESLQSSVSINALSELHSELERVNAQLAELKSQNRQLKTSNQALREEQQLKNYSQQIKTLTQQLEAHRSQIGAYDRKIQELQNKELSYQKTITELLDGGNLSVGDLLMALNAALSEATVNEYHEIFQIIWKYNSLKRKRLSKPKKLKSNVTSHELEHGYIVKNHDDYFFSSVNGGIYPIIANQDTTLINDLPASASIINGSAEIKRLYYDDSYGEKNSLNAKYNIRNVKMVSDELLMKTSFSDQYNILIVGSRNKNAYLDRLASAGLNPRWINLYEEHESRLSEKFSSADVVIICTRHSPHTALTLVDCNDPKVELLKRDNVDTVFHRARYSLIKQGLLKTRNN